MEDFYICIAVFSILISLAVLVWAVVSVALKIIDFRRRRVDAKRRKEHPELYYLFDAIEEKGGECIRYHNNEIAPVKRQIDKILMELKYLPDEKVANREIELRGLREKIYTAYAAYRVLEKERQELAKRIRAYVKEHDLEWARKQEWD